MGSAFHNIDRPLVLRLALGSDYPWEELLLVSSAQHGDGETFRFEIAVPLGPRAIHLIALDRGNGHQGST